jgi:hypothetical protein
LGEAMEYAKLIASSDLVPKEYRGKPANILLVMNLAHRLKVDLLQGLQNISVINGKAAIWGDLLWGIIQSQSDLEDAHETHAGSIEKGTYVATCTIKRRGRSEPSVVNYSIQDAKTANLWGKQGPWRTDPARMLQLRARSFCARDAYPDALRGMISAEEAKDYPLVVDQHGQATTLPTGHVMDITPPGTAVQPAASAPSSSKAPAEPANQEAFYAALDAIEAAEDLQALNAIGSSLAAATFATDQLAEARKAWWTRKKQLQKQEPAAHQGPEALLASMAQKDKKKAAQSEPNDEEESYDARLAREYEEAIQDERYSDDAKDDD